jgi:polyferredoxin
MDRIERPRGLIDWTTLAADAAAARRQKPAYRVVRPRTVIYATLLTIVAAVMVLALSLRADVEVNVLRDRSPQFVTLSDGSIRNGYTVKILNKTRHQADYRIRFEGLSNVTMMQAEGASTARDIGISVGPDTVGSYSIYVRAERGTWVGKFQSVSFIIVDAHGRTVARRATVFAAPD